MRQATLADALALARRAHAGQVDKAGKRYVGHPRRVAYSVDAAGGSDTALIAALLHDVVEDSKVMLDDLADAGFNPQVVSAVDALTKRSGESYSDFVDRAGSHPIARLVKLADLADNLDPARALAPTPRNLERADRYREAWAHLTGLPFPLGAPFPTPGTSRWTNRKHRDGRITPRSTTPRLDRRELDPGRRFREKPTP